jgi:hypothetical protein
LSARHSPIPRQKVPTEHEKFTETSEPLQHHSKNPTITSVKDVGPYTNPHVDHDRWPYANAIQKETKTVQTFVVGRGPYPARGSDPRVERNFWNCRNLLTRSHSLNWSLSIVRHRINRLSNVQALRSPDLTFFFLPFSVSEETKLIRRTLKRDTRTCHRYHVYHHRSNDVGPSFSSPSCAAAESRSHQGRLRFPSSSHPSAIRGRILLLNSGVAERGRRNRS